MDFNNKRRLLNTRLLLRWDVRKTAARIGEFSPKKGERLMGAKRKEKTTIRTAECAVAKRKNNMKTNNKIYLLAVGAAALSLSVATSVGQVFSAQEVANNRAIAESPRAKEAYPWLTRAPAVRVETWSDTAKANALTEARKNPAYATSPRVREVYPELAITPTPPPQFTIAPLIEKNDALLKSSPRYREEHPETSR